MGTRTGTVKLIRRHASIIAVTCSCDHHRGTTVVAARHEECDWKMVVTFHFHVVSKGREKRATVFQTVLYRISQSDDPLIVLQRQTK